MDWKKVTFETISYFRSCNQSPSIPTKNIHILDALKMTRHPWIKEKTLYAREAFLVNDLPLYKARKQMLPCVTFSGGFPPALPRKIENGVPTHTIVLDIDHISEMSYTVDELKNILFAYPSVYWVQTSCSGDGVFALVYVQEPTKRELYFNWFEKDLKDRYNIKLDKLDDITRLRFLTYDDSPLARNEIIPCVNEYEPKKKKRTYRPMSVYKQASMKVYNASHEFEWVPNDNIVEHLSHKDRMLLFNSLRCIYNDDRDKVFSAWEQCMHRMEYLPSNNTNLRLALDEPERNNWMKYETPHISYKILMKFYDKRRN